MKTKLLVRQMFSLALFLAFIVLMLALLLFSGLVLMSGGAVAQITANRRHRWLLRQLHKTGTPPYDFELHQDENYPFLRHDHHNCTPNTCVFKQAEEYYRLVAACAKEHVPDWRVRWAA